MNNLDSERYRKVTAEIQQKGFSLLKSAVDVAFCDKLRLETLDAVEREYAAHQRPEHRGRLLFAPIHAGAFLNVLELEWVFELTDRLLGTDSIIYTMTSSCIAPNSSNHTSTLHRDTHIDVGGMIPSLGVQILLDDFTENNGAPEFYPIDDSVNPPEEAIFRSNASHILGKKGDVLFFDTRCWHRSTENKTDAWRCCLLMSIVRNWMKQRFDVAEMMNEVDMSSCSPAATNRLGITSHPPGSYEAFFGGAQRF